MTSAATTPTSPEAAATRDAITARQLGKVIDDKAILADLSFTVPQGDYVALLGANGAGKSTLLKILSTLMPPSHGTITLFGRDLGKEGARLRSRIGLIGHGSMLYRDLSPLENLVLFGRLYRVARPAERATDLLRSIGLAGRARDPVKTFSRGMTQRVSIARALMHDPDLLLADEPFAGLDAPSVRIVETLMSSLNEAGKTVVLVNHDIRQSLELARHALVLKNGRLVMDVGSEETDAVAVLEEVSTA